MGDEQTRNGLLLVLMDVDADLEGEFQEWYDREHLPEKQGLPGFISARRFVAVDGSPKYLALYELESAETVLGPAYKSLPKTEWTKRMQPHFRNLLRGVYVEATPTEVAEAAQARQATSVASGGAQAPN
jgi:hypothetical protein